MQERQAKRGSMNSLFPLRYLAEVSRNLDAKRIPVRRQDRQPGPYPYYGASGIVDYVEGYIFDGEYLLIAEDGENLRSRRTPIAFLVKGKFWVNNHAHVIQGNALSNTKYLSYVFRVLDITPYLSGSTRPKLTQRDLNRILIPIPPLPEQRAIAHILGTLDDQIETLRRMNATLEGIARALFEAWFVDFEPVRAKMSGRWRRGQSLPGLPADLYDLFPDKLVPSALGEIPEGWRIQSLDDIADFLNGLALQKYPPEGDKFLPVIKIRELRAGYPGAASNKASVNIPQKYVIDDGDVIFSWSGSLLLTIWHGGKGALNQHLFKVTSPQYPKWFYFHWIDEHLPAFRRIAASKATTMGHIQRHHLTEAKVVVPPEDQLEAMSAIMSPLLDKRTKNAVQSRTLAALRDVLLPELISGHLRVADAERFLQERGL